MTIHAQDRPRYDRWGPDDHWGCGEWIEWHRALAAQYGEARADDIWASAWLDGLSRAAGGRGTAPGSGAIFDSVPISCRTLDSAFSRYVAGRRKLRDVVWSGIGGALTAPIAGAASMARGAGFGLQAAGDGLSQQPRASLALIFGAVVVGVWLLKDR